jgi:phosphoglucomutase
MHIVTEQAHPDPEFPTVSFPNPEEKGALRLSSREAAKVGTAVILANDPDADRFSAAERVEEAGGDFQQFTGNQLGILLASYTFETYIGDVKKLAMLSSTVSSRMLARMASVEGFHFVETLTGFKWLGNVAQDLQREGWNPAFAFEEAIGYMFSSIVWDKDGIAAAAVFLTAWQRWHAQGLTPRSKLQQLYERYGYFADANTYVISPSPEVTNTVFAAIRKLHPSGSRRPEKIGARQILRWRDLTLGYDSAATPPDHRPNLPVDPGAQMITCELEEDVVFTVRGSGTEPKIKFYIEATATSADEAQARADQTLRDLLKEWFQVDRYGLKLPAADA